MTTNWKVRKSIVADHVLETFPYFISESVKSTSESNRVRTKEFYILTVLKLLSCLKNEDRNFVELHGLSKISFKKSYLNYLKMCKFFGFIKNEKIQHNSIYSITEKGKIFLDLFEMKN